MSLMQKIKDHALTQNGEAYYAGVGLYNAEDRNLPVYLNEAYILEYEGLIKIQWHAFSGGLFNPDFRRMWEQ